MNLRHVKKDFLTKPPRGDNPTSDSFPKLNRTFVVLSHHGQRTAIHRARARSPSLNDAGLLEIAGIFDRSIFSLNLNRARKSYENP